MNAVLWDSWGQLDSRWNWQIPWKPYRLGSEKCPVIDEGRGRSIIYFTAREKPWLPGANMRSGLGFSNILDQTEWAGWRVSRWRDVGGRCMNLVRSVKKVVKCGRFA